MKYTKATGWFLLAIMMNNTVLADVVIDNQTIPNSDINGPITISPITGDIFITTKTGYIVTPGTEPPPNVAAITNFTASPSTIAVGESTTISWTSVYTNSCQAIGGTGGWAAASVALSGSKNIVINVEGTYLFTLSCVGDSGTVQAQKSVTVYTPTPIPDNCSAAPLSGTVIDWTEFWNGTPFPNPIYANEYTEIPRKGYVAIQFNTANYVDTGQLLTIETTATSGRRLGAISQCPGDFDVADECRHVWGVGGSVIWTTEGYSGACNLQPNKTYYFNVTFTDGVDPNSSECTASKCITKIRTNNPSG